jgi:hypothetical protein
MHVLISGLRSSVVIGVSGCIGGDWLTKRAVQSCAMAKRDEAEKKQRLEQIWHRLKLPTWLEIMGKASQIDDESRNREAKGKRHQKRKMAGKPRLPTLAATRRKRSFTGRRSFTFVFVSNLVFIIT